jgi:hypothetical protein
MTLGASAAIVPLGLADRFPAVQRTRVVTAALAEVDASRDGMTKYAAKRNAFKFRSESMSAAKMVSMSAFGSNGDCVLEREHDSSAG